MVYIIKDKETGIRLNRQKFKPSKEYLIFWFNQGFKPIVKSIKNCKGVNKNGV